jgi:serine/threonine protein kinase
LIVLPAGAMKALFAKGIVHRDLKPQNILLSHKNSGKNLPSPENITLKIAGLFFLTIFTKTSILIKFIPIRFRIREIPARWKHGCNIVWISHVYGTRSDNVIAV